MKNKCTNKQINKHKIIKWTSKDKHTQGNKMNWHG